MSGGVSRDSKHFREVLDEGVVLVDGDADGSVDIGAGKGDPVWVGIIVDVRGYGPHTGAIYVMQNRFHGNADEPLQEAEDLLEHWKHDHEKDYYEELVADEIKEGVSEDDAHQRAEEIFRETFDGWSFKLDPREFGEAIKGSEAAKFISVHDSLEEEREFLREKLRDLQKFYARYEDEVSPKEVKERSKRIEQLLAEGDIKEAEREIKALDKLV